MKEGLRRGAPLVCVALGCLLTLLLQRSFHIQFDEGYTLNAAWQMWHGMRMYDDFRLYVGPGSGYAVYWLWRLIGDPSFLAARVLSLLLSFSSDRRRLFDPRPARDPRRRAGAGARPAG